MERVCWVDGRLHPIEDARVGADDSAYAEGRGCYTSARVSRGAVRFEARHVRRLVRDARTVDLGEIDPQAVQRALSELAKAAFADAEGIVRLQASRSGEGRIHLVGMPRPLGDDPREWTAITSPVRHDGVVLPGGPKLTNRLTFALAADAARQAGAQEALLFDREGHLVEGARSNVIVVTDRGELVTAPLERGAVAGIAREIALERIPELRECDTLLGDLYTAREVVAVNAVRGARTLTALDGRPLGGPERAGCARLAEALEAD